MTDLSLRERLHAATGRTALREITARVDALEPAVGEEAELLRRLDHRLIEVERAVADAIETVLEREGEER